MQPFSTQIEREAAETQEDQAARISGIGIGQLRVVDFDFAVGFERIDKVDGIE